MTNMIRKETMIKKLRKEILSCRRCPLYLSRKNPVGGEGNPNSKIFFVGEAPGFNEDKEGKPFCGRAGKVFNDLLSLAGIKRENIYLTNLIKCRPPKNRNPQKKEIEKCSFYLEKELEIIKPKIIISLGGFPTKFFLKKFHLPLQPVSKIHGKVFSLRKIKFIPFYHPAAALYNPKIKKSAEKDFLSFKFWLRFSFDDENPS